MNCDAVEGIPAQTADSAIIVRLAPKVEAAQGFGRKLRDWARRKQGDRHPFTAGVLTSNSRDAFQQDVSVGSERSVVEHYLRSFEGVAHLTESLREALIVLASAGSTSSAPLP